MLATLLLASLNLISPPASAPPVSTPAPHAAPTATAWLLRVRNGDELRAVDPTDGATIDLRSDPRPSHAPGAFGEVSVPPGLRAGVLSPDGTRLAFVGEVRDGVAHPTGVVGRLCVSTPDGRDARVLIGTSEARRSLSWSPDGTRLAFEVDAPGVRAPKFMRRVLVVDPTTGVPRREFSGTGSVTRPRFTPMGNFTYETVCGREGKLDLVDLEFTRLAGKGDGPGDLPITLVRGKSILGSAFNPDESLLAYSVPGAMIVAPFDPVAGVGAGDGGEEGKDGGAAGATERRWTSKALGSELGIEWYTCFGQPMWRPDGRVIASRGLFLGGREGGDGSAAPGEDKVILFGLDGTARSIVVDPNWTLEGWIARADVEAQRK